MEFDQLIREGRDTDAVRLFAKSYYDGGKMGHTRLQLLMRVADELDKATSRLHTAERLIEDGIHRCTVECEALEKSALQLALDRIEAAIGFDNFSIGPDPIDGGYEAAFWVAPSDGGYEPDLVDFHGDTWAEAAEQAADWAEQQKVAVVKRCHTCKFLGDVEGGINYCDYHKAGVAAGGLCSQWAERQKEGNE